MFLKWGLRTSPGFAVRTACVQVGVSSGLPGTAGPAAPAEQSFSCPFPSRLTQLGDKEVNWPWGYSHPTPMPRQNPFCHQTRWQKGATLGRGKSFLQLSDHSPSAEVQRKKETSFHSSVSLRKCDFSEGGEKKKIRQL